MSGDYLGEFEHLVLLAVLRVGPDAYGVPIREEIEVRARRDVSFGAVYATLRRLEAKGLVRSRSGAGGEEGGRARKFIDVTHEGVRAIRASQGRLHRMTEGLTELLGDG